MLCQSGRVIRCAVPPYVVNPLSVSVQVNGKKRLILDLRYVNRHLQKKLLAISYSEVGAYMFTFHPKSGYHHNYRRCNRSPMLPWFFVGLPRF